jgi:hypothetical protein
MTTCKISPRMAAVLAAITIATAGMPMAASASLLQNPGFDNELDGWEIGEEVAPANVVPSALDADGRTDSGSALVSVSALNSHTFFTGPSQTVEVTAGNLEIRARILPISFSGDYYTPGFRIKEYREASCADDVYINDKTRLATATIFETTPPEWQTVEQSFATGDNTACVRVTFGFFDVNAGESIEIHLDDVYFGKPILIYADGFE